VGRKNRDKSRLRVGLPPGAAVYVGDPRNDGVTLRAMVYDGGGLVEHQQPDPQAMRGLVQDRRVVWLDCDGVHDPETVSGICASFDVHSLAVEHVLDTRLRPKLDVYENQQVVLSMNMLSAKGPNCVLASEHVTFVLGPGFLLSFQEGRIGDLFEPVRQRIRAGLGRIRTMGPDYLLHALVDAVVDECFVVVDQLEEQIDLVEGQAFNQKNRDLPSRIYQLKGDLATIRRSVFPLREPINRIVRGETGNASRGVEPYWRDLYDHVMQVLDLVDAGSDRLTSVLEVYLAAATHRMNDVMKVLTIVATIFIPLSWVAGVYGMNFDYMPELHWAFGYPLAVGLMVAIGLGMLGWFRWLRWL
jgi:magnesium transporter